MFFSIWWACVSRSGCCVSYCRAVCRRSCSYSRCISLLFRYTYSFCMEMFCRKSGVKDSVSKWFRMKSSMKASSRLRL